jgi:hypothetical protein
MSPAGIATLLALALVPVGSWLSSFCSISHLPSCVPWLHGVLLRRFLATTDALTCAGRGFRPIRGLCPRLPRQGSLLHARNLPTIPSPPTSRVRPGFSFVHFQHWCLSLAAGNSIPLGASLTTRRLAQHGPPYRVRHPTDWPFTFRCSPRWNRSNAVPSVTGGELLPEADFHRPDCATHRRTSAGILPA